MSNIKVQLYQSNNIETNDHLVGASIYLCDKREEEKRKKQRERTRWHPESKKHGPRERYLICRTVPYYVVIEIDVTCDSDCGIMECTFILSYKSL